MQEKWSFPDAGKLYSRKLIAERCLLALVRHGTSHELEKSDVDALRALRQMLTDAFEVDYGTNIASLSADTSINVNLVVNLLLTAKLVSSLPAVKSYLQELIQTVSGIENARVVERKQKDKVVKFVQVYSTNLGSEIVAKARGQDTMVSVLSP